MIGIEYLINALKIDVVDHKTFTMEQKDELMQILDRCPPTPFTINPIKFTEIGINIVSIIEEYNSKYMEFGGKEEDIKKIAFEYNNERKKFLRGFRGMKA